MAKRTADIKKETLEMLLYCKERGTSGYHICNYKSALGSKVKFKEENGNRTIELRLSQIGGFLSGDYCYTLD